MTWVLGVSLAFLAGLVSGVIITILGLALGRCSLSYEDKSE